jgi:hypothetical protein
MHDYVAVANTKCTVSIDLIEIKSKFPSVVRSLDGMELSDKNPNDWVKFQFCILNDYDRQIYDYNPFIN